MSVVLLTVLLLSACGRPLSVNERAFATEVFGPTLDVDRVRVAQSFNPRPVDPVQPAATEPLSRQPGICDRIAPRTEKPPPAAWAIRNQVHFSRNFYLTDIMEGWPRQVLMPQSLILLHELVHVWQWQNRETTGYRPIRAVFEGVFQRDPYFYQAGDPEAFLDRGYEEQAALLEDYMCYAIFDPGNPRRSLIRPIISGTFRVDRIDQIFDQTPEPDILGVAVP
ncbi:hypothetical protein [Actibacterium sp. 188UL27-1]|uniref:hypothetical protein n=1 Tax=Actibacterium sp. 188UL27-1 TaxID=2786961 RepID=UPI0019581A6E|nr:hypothetical protein [Actibacterium sp. 188UL27-1]MBM7068106.1 hypothetical protein [Actibacterium sp. 188UL27-1]